MKTIFVILLLGLLVMFALPNNAISQKPIELSLSHFFNTAYQEQLKMTFWQNEIEKRTNGRVKVTLFPAGTLTPPDKIYDAVTGGISQAGFHVLAYTPGRFPLMEACELPVGIPDAVLASLLVNDFYNKFKPQELSGTKQLMLFGAPPPSFIPVENRFELWTILKV